MAKTKQIVTEQIVTEPRKRAYNGPAKGSEEAKERMARVRAAQWAKNGLVATSDTDNQTSNVGPPFVRRVGTNAP